MACLNLEAADQRWRRFLPSWGATRTQARFSSRWESLEKLHVVADETDENILADFRFSEFPPRVRNAIRSMLPHRTAHILFDMAQLILPCFLPQPVSTGALVEQEWPLRCVSQGSRSIALSSRLLKVI